MDNSLENLEEVVEELELLTEGMLSQLAEADFVMLEAFVDQREPLMAALAEAKAAQALQPSLEQRAAQVVAQDPLFLARMQELKQEAAEWLQKRGAAKAQRSAYEQAYTPDSILLDRKK